MRDTTKKVLCNAFLMRECGLGPFVVIASVKPEEGSSSDKMIRLAGDVLFDLISLSDPVDRKRLKQLVDMADFSGPRLKAPVQKVEVSQPTKQAPLSVPSGEAFQVSWHPDLKVRDSAKKRRRKASSKREKTVAAEQPRLFDDE
jgi:hypothetical protein